MARRRLRWLREFLTFVMTEKAHNAILDFGGGDTSLAKLIDAAPDIATTLEEAGIARWPATLSRRVWTTWPRWTRWEAAGFKPKATVLMFNEGRVDSTISRDEAFTRIGRHSAVRSAVARGAVPLWMPRLEPEVMAEIEGKRLSFAQARDGVVPSDAKFAPIGGLERAMVRSLAGTDGTGARGHSLVAAVTGRAPLPASPTSAADEFEAQIQHAQSELLESRGGKPGLGVTLTGSPLVPSPTRLVSSRPSSGGSKPAATVRFIRLTQLPSH